MAKIAGSIPAEPTNSSYGGIAPAMNSPAGFGLFIGTGSNLAEPTIRHERRMTDHLNLNSI